MEIKSVDMGWFRLYVTTEQGAEYAIPRSVRLDAHRDPEPPDFEILYPWIGSYLTQR